MTLIWLILLTSALFLFFGIKEKIWKSKGLLQQKKLYKLLQESKNENNLEKLIFNFFKYVLSDMEKKILAKSLNFCLPPKQHKYADYLVNFESFYKDLCNLEIMSNENLDFVQTNTKETSLVHSEIIIKTHNKIFLRKKLQL